MPRSILSRTTPSKAGKFLTDQDVASNQGRLRLPGARKTRPQFCVSLPILSFQMVTSVRCVEVLVGTQRHDAGGVNVIVGDVIVSLNVIKVHRR